ncbi:hypothetical protein D3C85_1117130 [compost metagenome]
MSEHLTFHDTDEQLDKGQRPTVLLERPKSGEVVTATATGEYDEKTGLEYYEFVEGGEYKMKPLGLMSLSDQRQEELVKLLVPEHVRPGVERTEREPALAVAVEIGDVALAGAGIEAPGVAHEREKDPFDYLRSLLPPVTRPDKQPANLDHLYGSQEEYERVLAELQLTRKEQEQQKYYDRFVTEENKQASRETLVDSLKMNPEIGRVLHEVGIDASSMEAVNAIRENADVRYAVAKYFAQKLDDMVMKDPHGFGWRVEENRPDNLKEDPLTGKKMMSRDYVVSLVLKMLDGEFSVSNEDDSFTRDSDGRVAVAQHRDAARRLLMGKSWQ